MRNSDDVYGAHKVATEMRRIAVITGTRAEYGLLRRSMDLIAADDDLSLQLYVTGMHLSPTHGKTVSEIRADGFDIDYEVEMNLDSDSVVSMGKALGIGVMGFSEGFRNLEPDIVLLLGDRTEPFAATIAASHMNLPVAHIGGGHISGGAVIDANVRHAITKLSHLHFATSRDNAARIGNLGEKAWRITPVGAPGLDDIHDENFASPEEVYESYDIPADEPIVVVLQHPTTTRPSSAGEQMRRTLDAVRSVDCYPFIIYPNSDVGANEIMAKIDAFEDTVDSLTVTQNVSRSKFLGLLNVCDALVGNSSSGLVEAPSLDVPVVNVGPRQEGRERTDNVIDVSHEQPDIQRALRKALVDDEFREAVRACDNPYFLGGTASQIHARLKDVEIGRKLLEKWTEL